MKKTLETMEMAETRAVPANAEEDAAAGAAAAAAPPHQQDPKPSLFPLASPPPNPPSDAARPQWLSNSSFTFDVSSLCPPPSSSAPPHASDSDSSDYSSAAAPPSRPPAYDLLDSSPSDPDTDPDRRDRPEKSKKKRKRKRRRSRDSAPRECSRKSGVRRWAGSEAPAIEQKDYYVDSRGDRDNLAFGSLYRMDVPRYKVHGQQDSSGAYWRVFCQWKQKNSVLDAEIDADSLDFKSREGERYFSTKYLTLERHKDFKRVRLVAAFEPFLVPGEFISLDESLHLEQCNNTTLAKAELEESWDDEVLRRTKEFNKMSREFPHDEKVWLAFAEFQDKIAARQPQKAARMQTLERKISILEKAVELNPDDEGLVLRLLKAYQSRDSTEVMDRWKKVLRQHSSSCKLWKEFLLVCQGEFSRFKVSDLRKIYACAIRALASECSKLCRQVHQAVEPQSKDPTLVKLELGLVDVFISLCRFEWQAGYREMATGLFQAEMEYSLFFPSLLLSEQSKQRLFEHFWNGNGARIGEDGALGWSSWLEKEEQNMQRVIDEESTQETEAGGWTGWSEPIPQETELCKEPENLEDVVSDENAGENVEAEGLKTEDDIESMLMKLGINVDSEADCEVKDTATWKKWSQEEASRDCNQWMPVREHAGENGDEQLSRVILYEDIFQYIFSLRSEEARFSLVAQFVNFYGGKISQRISTNSTSWAESIFGLETFLSSILDDLGKVHEVVAKRLSASSQFSLEFLLDNPNGACGSGIMKFLRNSLLLCLNVFTRNYVLEEAVLVAEELYAREMNACTVSVTSSRGLAKFLLKNDRQDLLLCGVYARREAASGNIEIARRVFDMALSSTEGLPPEIQINIPLLYFWYAEMELANCTSGNKSEPAQRATHILSCLGSGLKYNPFKCQASSTQLLRARQGFKEQIRNLRSSWACRDIKDSSIALICSAALFEELTTSWDLGLTIIEEAFTMVLPERRSHSSQLESLFNYYVEMLIKHLKHSKLSKVWKCILRGLQMYPYSPKLFAAFIEVSCVYTVPHKIRQIIDEYCSRKPSVLVWMFALSFEIARAGSEHRVHSLFERALVNDQLQKAVILWRYYLAYEVHIARNLSAAKRIFFRAIHACPWSKKLWLDGFQKLLMVLTAKELTDLQEVMSDKELHLRTDIYEILLQEEINV